MADILETLSEALDAFETRCLEIAEDMRKAEAVGNRLGIAVPWAVEEPQVRRKRAYHRHDDAMPVIRDALRSLPAGPFRASEVAQRVNARMVSESRPPFTTEAVVRQLGKIVDVGELIRCDDEQGRRWRIPPSAVAPRTPPDAAL
jgi:hypothetical protein